MSSGRILVIMNPISGRRRSHHKRDRLFDCLTAAGYQLDVRQTHKAGDAKGLAASALGSTLAVMVYGGDGTVREAAGGLSGRSIPIYHLPGGNENLFARHFGMSLKPQAILNSLARREIRRVDLVDVNGLACTSCLGVGFDAHVVHMVHRKRTGHISDMNYAGPIAAAFLSYVFPHLEVRSAGQTVFSGQGMLFGGNLTRYAVGMPLFGRAVDDDGLLDVLVFPCRTRRRLLGDLFRTLLRRHYKSKAAIYFRTDSLEVIADPAAACQLDGDIGPAPPLTIKVLPKSLAVLM